MKQTFESNFGVSAGHAWNRPSVPLATAGSPCDCRAGARCRPPDPLGAAEGVTGSVLRRQRTRPPV